VAVLLGIAALITAVVAPPGKVAPTADVDRLATLDR